MSLGKPYYERAVVRVPRRFIWPSALLFFCVCGGSPCLADGSRRVVGGVESAYTGCLSAKPSCRSVARTQFRLQYKPIVGRTFSVRIRLSHAYQLTLDDDKENGASEEQRASRLSPPLDVVDIKLRFSKPDGRDQFDVRTGYSYQHSNPNAADGYHAVYVSGDYYFGAPIQSGWGALSRRLDVLMRVSQDVYARANRSAEDILQFVPTYTIPLTNNGTTRLYASYARELRFSGGNSVRTPSNRLDFGVIRDATRWLQFYGRFSLFGTRGVSGTAKLVLGVDVTI